MILTCLSAPDSGMDQEGKGADMARDVVAEIRRATRRKFRADDKIRIVLKSVQVESPILTCAGGRGSRRLFTTSGPRLFWKPGKTD